jgi:predicted nucleic acid-binding protein
MNKAVYLDSTIPSYLFDKRESLETYTAITKKWWEEESENYRVFVSGETVAETSRGDHPYRGEIMSFVSQLELLPYDEQLDQIVEVYIANHLMPRSSTGDSLHLAYASLYKIDFLLTWNCNHLANANKKQHIRVINTRLGLFIPEITTPMELFTETTS